MSVVDNISVNPAPKREIICQVCNKSFKRGKDLKSHSVIHNDAKPYVCNQCPEAFKHKASLKRHSLIHSGEKPFTCRICGKCFRQKGSLNEHSLTHTGEKPHICEVCNLGFSTKSNYGRHLRKHLISQQFICNICHKEFSVRANLTRHFKKHKEAKEIDPAPKSQLESKKIFNDNGVVHVIEQSPSNVLVVTKEVVKITDQRIKKYICKMCNKHFDAFNELKIHLSTHKNKKTYVCDICSRCFTNIGAYCKHKVTHNQESENIEDNTAIIDKDEEKIVPDVDEESSVEVLDEHKTTHDEETLLSESFAEEAEIIYCKPEIIVPDIDFEEYKEFDKLYGCKICHKTFSKAYQFMHHSVIHKQPGPYYCDICGKTVKFEKLQELHEHYTDHGEMACICYNCNDDSVTHDKYYSKGNASRCDVCFKCFPSKILLKRHLANHKDRRALVIKLNT